MINRLFKEDKVIKIHQKNEKNQKSDFLTKKWFFTKINRNENPLCIVKRPMEKKFLKGDILCQIIYRIKALLL